ncbi:MAG: peptidoglycan recognition protein family protein [Selenomonadaceae bacterium]|nr:peptidoglycan recognition protein family protein [Selenomonadaceae bacterium]
MATAGFFLTDNTASAQYSSEIWEPPIEKLFLPFGELKDRKETERIVIHHAGLDKDYSAHAIHKFHRDVRGWSGIGYHYVIRKDGTIEQGRPSQAVGAHAANHNYNSIGICVTGNFNVSNPKTAQIDSLKMLTAWLCQKYNLNPMGNGVIVGHKNLNKTTCPGSNLYPRIEEVKCYCRDFIY